MTGFCFGGYLVGESFAMYQKVLFDIFSFDWSVEVKFEVLTCISQRLKLFKEEQLFSWRYG